jgi:dTDP-4-amino-4,6-dideoxygalactose transaminase
LYAQLEARDQIQTQRKRIWRYYYENLQGWARDRKVGLPVVPTYCEQTYHMFYLILTSPDQRQAMIEYLKARGINAVFHYLPLHLSEMGRRFGARPGDCPVTERVSDCLLRLPFYNELTESEQAQVVSAITQFES